MSATFQLSKTCRPYPKPFAKIGLRHLSTLKKISVVHFLALSVGHIKDSQKENTSQADVIWEAVFPTNIECPKSVSQTLFFFVQLFFSGYPNPPLSHFIILPVFVVQWHRFGSTIFHPPRASIPRNVFGAYIQYITCIFLFHEEAEEYYYIRQAEPTYVRTYVRTDWYVHSAEQQIHFIFIVMYSRECAEKTRATTQ